MSRRTKLTTPFSTGFNPRSRLADVLQAGLDQQHRSPAIGIGPDAETWLASYRKRLLQGEDEARQDNERLLAELELYKQRNTELQEAMDTLSETKLADRQRLVDTLKKDLAKKEAELQEASSAETALLLSLSQLTNEVDGLETKLKQVSSSKDEATLLIKAELEQQLADAQGRLDAAKVMSEEQKQVLEQAEKAFRQELARNKALQDAMELQNEILSKDVLVVKSLTEAAKEGVSPSMEDQNKLFSAVL